MAGTGAYPPKKDEGVHLAAPAASETAARLRNKARTRPRPPCIASGVLHPNTEILESGFGIPLGAWGVGGFLGHWPFIPPADPMDELASAAAANERRRM